jgi:hypothetical protein
MDRGGGHALGGHLKGENGAVRKGGNIAEADIGVLGWGAEANRLC